jgi:hypothetical protein
MQSVVAANDLNGAALPTTTTNYTYDNYGDALTVDLSVTYSGTTSTKNTTNTYCVTTSCVSNWFLGRLLTTSVNSVVGSSNLTRQSSFAYSATTGLLTQESIEPALLLANSIPAIPMTPLVTASPPQSLAAASPPGRAMRSMIR